MAGRLQPGRTAVRPSTELRRREILAAALQCFSERGFEATTLGEICARSGASVGTIYHLFASKEEIAGAVYVEGLREYQQAFLATLDALRSAEALICAFVEHYLAWVEDHAKLARFILHTRRAELVPAIRAELRTMNRAFFRVLDEQLDRHAKPGALKPLPRELLLDVVMGPAQEHARHWLAGRTRIRPREAAPLLADAAWDGVRSSGPARKRG